VSDTKLAPAPVIAPGRAGTAERALARCAETVSALVRQVDAARAGEAILRVASRTESRNMISDYLVAHPTALVDGDSGAPGPVARLIEELIAGGVEGLPRPRCLDCGRPKRLCGVCPAVGSATAAATEDDHRRCARSAARSPAARSAMRTATRSARAAISSPTCQRSIVVACAA
jgi:hypothetical protein